IVRAYFYDGAPAVNYYLFDMNANQYVSDPLGPVGMNASIPLPPGAVAGVEFSGVPDGDYVVRVFCEGGGTVNIGGLGISVAASNAITVSPITSPDCDVTPGLGT